MAGLNPAIPSEETLIAPADAGALGGRVKPGHGELG
jgi:hypothetical protein